MSEDNGQQVIFEGYNISGDEPIAVKVVGTLRPAPEEPPLDPGAPVPPQNFVGAWNNG